MQTKTKLAGQGESLKSIICTTLWAYEEQGELSDAFEIDDLGISILLNQFRKRFADLLEFSI